VGKSAEGSAGLTLLEENLSPGLEKLLSGTLYGDLSHDKSKDITLKEKTKGGRRARKGPP